MLNPPPELDFSDDPPKLKKPPSRSSLAESSALPPNMSKALPPPPKLGSFPLTNIPKGFDCASCGGLLTAKLNGASALQLPSEVQTGRRGHVQPLQNDVAMKRKKGQNILCNFCSKQNTGTRISAIRVHGKVQKTN